MNKDDLRREVLKGARPLEGAAPETCLLAMRDVLGRPEPMAEVWDAMAGHERRAVVLYAGLPGLWVDRRWARLADAARAAVRAGLSELAALGVRLDAEARCIKGVSRDSHA